MQPKGKGSEFERKVCKMISKWIQGTEKPYLVWRGAGSGSLVDSSKNLSSDIHSISEKSAKFCKTFSIECKKGYPQASLDKFLNSLSSDPFTKAWGQVCADADKAGKLPMLIFSKKNNPVTWVCTSMAPFWAYFGGGRKCRYMQLTYEDDSLMYVSTLSSLLDYDFEKFIFAFKD